MTSDVFDLAKANMSQEDISDVTGESMSPSGFDVFDIALDRMSNPQDESKFDSFVRNVTRTGSRMVESVLGMPGDFFQFAKATAQALPDIPNDIPSLVTGKKPEFNFIQKGGRQLLEQLPTQQSLQKRSESITEGFTTPQGTSEEIGDEVAKTFTNLFVGGGGVKGLLKKGSTSPYLRMARDIGTAIGGESAKEGMKILGATPTQQELGKLSSIFMLGMGLPHITGETSPNAFLSNIYKERDALIPKGTMVSPQLLSQKLKKFINKTLERGGPTPEKRQVKSIASEFLDKIDGSTIEMDELLQMYRDINRNRSAIMAAKDLDKPGVRAARRYFGEMANMFDESIEGYLGSINGEALNLHRNANQGWAALHQSNRARNYILDVTKGLPLKTGVGVAFGGGIYSNPLLATGAAATGAAGLKGGEVLYRILKSPTLRKYYGDVLKNALKEDALATQKSLTLLDKYYDKEIQSGNSE